jgi:hypothetical protein
MSFLPDAIFYLYIINDQVYYTIILALMSHNVPAVCGVFVSPIKETVGFQGLQKCGWS